MEPKDSIKFLNPAFIRKLRHLFISRAGLAVLAAMILLTALAFSPASVTSAVGKLWRGIKPSSTKKTETTKPGARKSKASATAQKAATLATDKPGYLVRPHLSVAQHPLWGQGGL